MVLPPLSIRGFFFPKKAFHGEQTIFLQKIMGRLFQMGGVMIRSFQGGGGIS